MNTRTAFPICHRPGLSQLWPGRRSRPSQRTVLGPVLGSSPEMRVFLEEHRFLPGGLGQAQPVGDLLLAPAPHHHVALLQMVREVLSHFHDRGFRTLVHEIRFGQDSWGRGGKDSGRGQVSPPVYLTAAGSGSCLGLDPDAFWSSDRAGPETPLTQSLATPLTCLFTCSNSHLFLGCHGGIPNVIYSLCPRF